MKFRVLTLNIHKGVSAYQPRLVLEKLKFSIQNEMADLVLLQEVVGKSSVFSRRFDKYPNASQYEFLADKIWPYYAYGKNAATDESDHGNAILSKFPIEEERIVDLSVGRHERRGLLVCKVVLPIGKMVYVACTHLGLFKFERKIQMTKIERDLGALNRDEALIFGGDFNDWRGSEINHLEKSLDLREAYREFKGKCCRTFPAIFPIWPLDRMYVRKLHILNAYCPRQGWARLSDHLALVADLKI